MESMLRYDTTPGLIRPDVYQLFKASTSLWKPTEAFSYLKPTETYKFLFTIQMPSIQFPPSINHSIYRCTFKLFAYIDLKPGYTSAPITTQTEIKYIPLIESRLLKTSIYLQDLKKKTKSNKIPNVAHPSIKLHSIEYVIGSTIQATAYLTDTLYGSSIQSLSDAIIVLNLYQIFKFNSDTETVVEDLVETKTHIIQNYNDDSNIGREYTLSIPIKESLPPSFKYGMFIDLSYKLKIKIHLRKSKTPTSKINTSIALESKNHVTTNTPVNINKDKIRKYMGFSWSTTIASFETPIIIATLGRGINAGDELKEYTKFKPFSSQMPSPCFIKSLEYGDALPKYEAARLPSYSDTHGSTNTSSTIQI